MRERLNVLGRYRSWDRLTPRRIGALATILAALAALAYRSTVAAQADAVVVLSSVLETPALGWIVAHATDEPDVRDAVVGGVPTMVARPGGSGPWPAIVFVNGVTPLGRHEPRVQALAHGLARAGYLVLVPDPPGLAAGEVTPRTLAAIVAVAGDALARRDAAEEGVALVGVSVGASLALVAAANPALRERVSVVAGIAPYTDMVNVFRLATVDAYGAGGRLVPYETGSFLELVAARSLVASLPAGRERSELLAALPATSEVSEDALDPVARLRAADRRRLSTPARSIVALLSNRDPTRFDTLYGALPRSARAANVRLSPLAVAKRLRAPVEIASAPEDKYFPLAESRALARVAPDVRVTVTTTLAHAVPEPSPRGVADLFRFDAFVVRVLDRAS